MKETCIRPIVLVTPAWAVVAKIDQVRAGTILGGRARTDTRLVSSAKDW